MSTPISRHPLLADLLAAQENRCIAGRLCLSGERTITSASQLIVNGILRGVACKKCVHTRPREQEWIEGVVSREAHDLLEGVPRGFPGLRRRSSSISERADAATSLNYDSEFDVPRGSRYYQTRVHVLFEKQLRRCAICLVPVKLGATNHERGDCDHLDAHVRGVLCRRCNPAVSKDADEWTPFIRFYNVLPRWQSYVDDPPAPRLLSAPLLHRRRYDQISQVEFARLLAE